MDLRKPILGRVSLEISEQYYFVILPLASLQLILM
jgi:hypothetical protein